MKQWSNAQEYDERQKEELSDKKEQLHVLCVDLWWENIQ